ncbi:MAG: hypothetical protein H6510_04115 [Acidobacteria bacterium]|nr:hypothetical protein [Acidobacteriota bacterium]MCB9396981.1 hypothetical protein [Acidobacteriota bacterium]
MKRIGLILLTLGSSVAWAQSNELILPWVTNSTQFKSSLAINNLSTNPATISFSAVRANGETATASRTLDGFGQLVESADTLFPDLQPGGGFTVTLSAENGMLTAGFVVSSTASNSGNSPAQANAVTRAQASNIVIFNLLTLPSDGGASAPVVVNTGDQDADVTFHGYQNGQKLGTFVINVPAGRPYANLTSTMFPNQSGELYVVAECNEPILGMAFIFNGQLEPSMANADPVAFVPEPPVKALTSFSQNVQPILTANCAVSGCHSTAFGASNLVLASSAAYGDIVDVPSIQMPSLMRVKPGSSNTSYLYQKINPTGFSIFGGRMPDRRPSLSDADIETIRQWIDEGALNN